MDKKMKLIKQRGFSLIEVLIAIVIFAVGMLALAALQGALSRSASDANLRTTAVNIAERTIEDLRGFGRIDTDPAGLILAYEDIAVSMGTPITDGAMSFSRDITVTPYFYDLPTDAFTATEPDGVLVSDFKLLTVTVAWGAGAGFLVVRPADRQIHGVVDLGIDDRATLHRRAHDRVSEVGEELDKRFKRRRAEHFSGHPAPFASRT